MALQGLPSEKKNIFALAIASAVMTIFASIVGAPFVRVLAFKKAKLFWLMGIALLSLLFVPQLQLLGIYVSAIWMTLGTYSELEKRGYNWKSAIILSLTTGFSMGAVIFTALTRLSVEHNLIVQVTEPLMNSLKQIAPEQNFNANSILGFMPSLFVSSLMIALASSFMFESNIFKTFKLRREKIVSSLRWLEIRLPDAFVWFSLFSFLFSIIEIPIKSVQIIAINCSVISLVAYFFQGLAVHEFAFRIFRAGFFTKLSLYLLIVLWAMPVVAAVGLFDYWIDFRKKLRKKISQSF